MNAMERLPNCSGIAAVGYTKASSPCVFSKKRDILLASTSGNSIDCLAEKGLVWASKSCHSPFVSK